MPTNLESIYPSFRGYLQSSSPIGPINDMAVRLPRIDWAVENVDKEFTWLPKLALLLPISVPSPIGKGIPALANNARHVIQELIQDHQKTISFH